MSRLGPGDAAIAAAAASGTLALFLGAAILPVLADRWATAGAELPAFTRGWLAAREAVTALGLLGIALAAVSRHTAAGSPVGRAVRCLDVVFAAVAVLASAAVLVAVALPVLGTAALAD